MQNMLTIPDWSDKTILIVEDEEINRFFFKTALKVTNVNLEFATNGFEGIEMAINNDRIDCILMDIRMPVIDGYEAMKQIKVINNKIPIIAVTAYAQKDDKEKMLSSGFDDYLAKPIKIELLINTFL